MDPKKPFAHILQMSLKHELNQFHCNSDHEISFSQKDRSPSLGIPRYSCSGHCLSLGADCSCLPSRNIEVISLATAGRNVQYY